MGAYDPTLFLELMRSGVYSDTLKNPLYFKTTKGMDDHVYFTLIKFNYNLRKALKATAGVIHLKLRISGRIRSDLPEQVMGTRIRQRIMARIDSVGCISPDLILVCIKNAMDEWPLCISHDERYDCIGFYPEYDWNL
ncbi:replication enhancer protein [Persimmon circular DNA virus]|nr:replication enhancer protein [Persimmon circular DNA virus]